MCLLVVALCVCLYVRIQSVCMCVCMHAICDPVSILAVSVLWRKALESNR